MARVIHTRFATKCATCGKRIPVGTKVRWFPKGRGNRGSCVKCLDCNEVEENKISRVEAWDCLARLAFELEPENDVAYAKVHGKKKSRGGLMGLLRKKT